MNYNKPPLSIENQVKQLKSRGLTIEIEPFADTCLSNISYYRLRAYTFPFQDNTDSKHPFVVPVTLEEIIALYNFDRKLRLLAMDGIEGTLVARCSEITTATKRRYWLSWRFLIQTGLDNS